MLCKGAIRSGMSSTNQCWMNSVRLIRLETTEALGVTLQSYVTKTTTYFQQVLLLTVNYTKSSQSLIILKA